jgi:putative ABC transport system ATP-binding protein
MVSSDPLLRASGLCRKTQTGQSLIHGASLDLRAGDRLAIAGPSGAGKTVLLRALALLDPLDEGVISFRGALIRGAAVPAYRKHVCYVHQSPALLEGTVESNLRHPYALGVHARARFDRTRILGLLDDLGMQDLFLAKSSRHLSGGEAQIVAILRAVQLDPSVLLLDEPTASLDDATVLAIEGLVRRWLDAAPARRAFLWVSHNSQQAARIASRWLTMRSGELIAEG